MTSESFWLQSNAVNTFCELENLLRQACQKLRVCHKIENYGNYTDVPSQAQKFTLIARNSSESFKTTVTFLDENIIQTEIVLQHSKIPGGFFRSSATPDVQWKVQQLQDTGNHCAIALQLLLKFARYNNLNGFSLATEHLLLHTLRCIRERILDARSSLILPRKKSLVELCQQYPNKSFYPPLPSDILLSFYISSSKLVCAAYQVSQSKPVSNQSVAVFQAEAHLYFLADLLHLLNSIFSKVQELLKKFEIINTTLDAW